MNCERARTVNSNLLQIAGLYASVNGVSNSSDQNVAYISATGIQQIAFEEVQRKDVITPYGSFPSILANFSVGLVWYLNMLKGPRMQGPYGSTEGVNLNGTMISPLMTWDSKITTVVSMLGGIVQLTSRVMQNDPKVWQRFNMVVNREYSLAFPHLNGEDIPLALPTVIVPRKFLGNFADCN